MSIKEQKAALRKTIAQRKKQYNAADLSELSSTLLCKLEESSDFIQAHNILLYYSLPDEVQTQAFIEKWKSDKNIILPVVTGDNLQLKLYEGKDSLHVGPFNILEPDGPQWTNYQQIDLCLIPGVGFDPQGRRLGRGKGYYDRLLPQIAAYKMGICFSFQITDQLPDEPFDIRMDEVWTEKGKLQKGPETEEGNKSVR